MVALTGIGLSAAAGLNAYIPFLLVALVGKFTPWLPLPEQWSWITSWWAIGVGVLLLLVDVVADKIPAVDSMNDVVQTVVRPATAGLISAATAAAENFDHSPWMRDHQWVGIVIAVVVALLVHSAKATARPVVNTATAGMAAPVVSVIEDVFSLLLSLVALLLPWLVIGLLVLMVMAVIWVFKRRKAKTQPVA